MLTSIAMTRLSDLLNQKQIGEPINTHVVPASKEPTPDFEAMRKLVHDREAAGKAAKPVKNDK